MPQPPAQPILSRTARGYAKIVGVAFGLAIALALLIAFVNRETVNGLRHHLTLSLVIAVVAIINITAFMLFALFYLLYRWVKRDLDPQDDEEAT